jgi:hypothetical protein
MDTAKNLSFARQQQFLFCVFLKYFNILSGICTVEITVIPPKSKVFRDAQIQRDDVVWTMLYVRLDRGVFLACTGQS